MTSALGALSLEDVAAFLHSDSPEPPHPRPAFGGGASAANSPSIENAQFSTDSGVTRYVKLELKSADALRARNVSDFATWVKSSAFREAEHVYQTSPTTIIAKFSMLSQAERAVFQREELAGYGTPSFLSIEEFVLLTNGMYQSSQLINRYEGQICVEITSSSTFSHPALNDAWEALLIWMDEWLGRGSKRAVQLVEKNGRLAMANALGAGFQFRIELDTRDMADVLIKVQGYGRPIEGTNFSATVLPFMPADYRPVSIQAAAPYGAMERRASQSNFQTGGPVQPHHSRGYSGPRRSSFGRHRDDQSNAIDVDRIKRGQDVRTTVMLRNIPNQMTTYDLEGLLKGWAFGMYDFLYLRIDFANMCNVGYAFVNFDSPMTIVRVKEQLDKEGWPGHLSSNKKAAMSYATVQGVESLIEKFRNSSVMLEAPRCRPRLFYTWQDVYPYPDQWGLQATEKPFPDPNNEAKLARSRQNAETQGLFPAHSRDEHRRAQHSSHFDRGNPNAFYGYLGYY
ncbi:putative meiosis protein mei2 protein [Neofusicoccum parvum]|nr:putative meiosis protein mei2 protein [Neofusicoccum parvum]